ncbi:ROK family protein [Alteribacillus sp. HJP-4]|uniref:ROK family protein n=1 Tax=Alteribacillus sp. HJP-4 TaxID=2775394 RepID=UPI0035CCEB15
MTSRHLEDLLQTCLFPTSQLEGIGVASAGLLDTKNNKIIYAQNLNTRYVKIREILTKRFLLPVKICNDVIAAALAECHWGYNKKTYRAVGAVGLLQSDVVNHNLIGEK